MKAKYFLLLVLFNFSCRNSTKEKSIVTEKQPEEKIEVIEKPSIPLLEQKMIEQGLVNIQSLDSTIMVELKYSTTDNFVGEDVYGELTNAYMQAKPAEMLVNASKKLQAKYPNYRLLVYDAARPLSAQHTLWNILDSIPPKKRADFVANPAEGSIHNFGSAVDLTVFDVSTKSPIDMGTKYDFFGDLAYPRLESVMLKKGLLTHRQLENRLVLRNVMQQAGFQRIESEWWHFNALSRKQAKAVYKIIE